MRREIYARALALRPPGDALFTDVLNLAVSLHETGRYAEAKSLLRKQLIEARRALGTADTTYMKLRWIYATCLYDHDGASGDDEVEAVAILEELSSTARRVLGPNNPITTGIQRSLEKAKIPSLVIRT